MTKLHRKAKRAYNFFVDAQPVVFQGNFYSWDEISPEERKDWMTLNDLARRGYERFVSLMPKRTARGIRSWNKLTEAERHVWRMNERKAMGCYQQIIDTLRDQTGVTPWCELSIRQQHFYRKQAMSQ